MTVGTEQTTPKRPKRSGLAGQRHNIAGQRHNESRAGVVLIMPTTILLAVFYLYPLAQTVYYSFTSWNPATGKTDGFVGLSNFTGALTDPEFLKAAANTGLYVIIVVPVSMAVGLVLAALLATPFHGRALYRAFIFTPYIAPIVGTALIFTYLLSPLGGIMNVLLGIFGIQPINFLNTEPWALVTVIAFSIWQLVGYTMIIFSAALSAIPASYREAATLDGAGPIRQFFKITLPLVGPTSGFLAITGIVGSLQVFTQVYVLTQGGPLQSTETLLYWIYQQGFVLFDGGAASAGAVLLLIVGIAASIGQIWWQSRLDVVEMI